MSLFLDSARPGQLLEEPVFLAGVIALCLVTGMTFLPGSKRFQPWMMTTIPLLDIGVIGLFSLIPGAGTGSAIIVIMPAMWLSGTLGRLGIAVAATASTVCLVAPDLYLHGPSGPWWSDSVSIILFATFAGAGMTDRFLLLGIHLLAAQETEVTPMRLAIETVDVGALAQLSVDDIDMRARAGGLSLARHLPQGILIQADPNRLLQILDNLLSNALKFTPVGGRISLSVRPQATGVDLTVTDTGVGMDQVSLRSLGMTFPRAPETTASAIPGIGLGLTITKSIVEAHNGSLTFFSRAGVGTSVVVHLPTLAPSTPRSKPRRGSVALTTLSAPRA